MKEKIKIIIGIIILIIVSVAIVDFFESSNTKEPTGNLVVLANSKSYDYLKEAGSLYEKTYKKTKVQVINAGDNEKYYNELVKSYNEKKEIDVAVLDSAQLHNLFTKNNIQPVHVNNIINTYNMNFNSGRLNQVEFGNNYLGVPFTSRPLALFVRVDLLNKYGYAANDINTWNDLITIGESIYKKSKGQIRILDGEGEALKDLKELLIMQYLNSGLSKKEVINKTNQMLNEFTKNNILATKRGEGYIGAIGSINVVSNIKDVKEKCVWQGMNPPSLVIGGNKFYEGEGENLVVLTNEKAALARSFVSFVTNNTKLSLKYTLEDKVFSSYNYTYKDVKIEDGINNFTGKSPLVIMSNITSKAPSIKNYREYLQIKDELIK